MDGVSNTVTNNTIIPTSKPTIKPTATPAMIPVGQQLIGPQIVFQTIYYHHHQGLQ